MISREFKGTGPSTVVEEQWDTPYNIDFPLPKKATQTNRTHKKVTIVLNSKQQNSLPAKIRPETAHAYHPNSLPAESRPETATPKIALPNRTKCPPSKLLEQKSSPPIRPDQPSPADFTNFRQNMTRTGFYSSYAAAARGATYPLKQSLPHSLSLHQITEHTEKEHTEKQKQPAENSPQTQANTTEREAQASTTESNVHARGATSNSS